MSAFSFMFRIVSKVQERVQSFIRFEDNVASNAAVAARGTATRDELFASKRGYAVAAVTGFYLDTRPVDEHGSILSTGYVSQQVDYAQKQKRRIDRSIRRS